jgi:hypothetical protein
VNHSHASTLEMLQPPCFQEILCSGIPPDAFLPVRLLNGMLLFGQPLLVAKLLHVNAEHERIQ